MSAARKRNTQQTFDRLCDNARKHLSRNEPLPATLDAILLGYLGFISMGSVIADSHYREMAKEALSNPHAKYLMPSTYQAICDIGDGEDRPIEVDEQVLPVMENVSAWL